VVRESLALKEGFILNTNLVSLEQRTVKKVMLRILPFVWILYIVAFLDRVNIGYAALQMNKDLALSAEVFGVLSGVFFIGYFFFEVPSNILMQRFGARLWIARIMISWGLIVVLTGFAQSKGHLYILRFLLGVAEAGFFPGIIFYLTYWFRSQEMGRAYSLFIIALPSATIVGAPISTWIIDHIKWLGITGWRWMFILEGFLAIFFGILCLFYLANRPKDAKWLTNEEKTWLEAELEKERVAKNSVRPYSKIEVFKSMDLWKFSFVYFAVYSAIYGLSFWLPTIMKTLSGSISNTYIGFLTIIPSIAAIPTMIWWARHSDRTAERRIHVMAPMIIAAFGFIGGGLTTNPYIALVFITLASMGIYSFTGPFFAFLALLFSESAAAVGIAVVNSIASLGGFLGPTVFGYFKFSGGMFVLCTLLIIGSLPLLKYKQRYSQFEQSMLDQ
jgi:MFS transporter, ACS family, tartrate transporter